MQLGSRMSSATIVVAMDILRGSARVKVADVKKPLLSVKRIVEKGNKVSFGPGIEDNYIVHD